MCSFLLLDYSWSNKNHLTILSNLTNILGIIAFICDQIIYFTYQFTFGLITLTGASSPRGEGILRVWDSFQAYIEDENRQGLASSRSRITHAYGYKVFDSQASLVLNFYNDLIKTAKPHQERAHFKSYILAQDYFALAPNCTTQSSEATKKAIPSMTKSGFRFVNADKVLPTSAKLAFKASKYEMPKYLFLPDNLNDYLMVSPDVKVDMRNTHRHQK